MVKIARIWETVVSLNLTPLFDFTGVWYYSLSIKVPGFKINTGEWRKVKKNNPEILNLFNTHIGKSQQQVKLNNRDFSTDVEGRRGVGYKLGAAAQLSPILLRDTNKPVILC